MISISDKQDKLIVKSNKLIEASYRLSTSEQRLIYLLASTIKKDDDRFNEYTFKVQDIIDFLGLKGESYYSELKKITRNLLSKTVSIQEPDGVLQVNWVTSAKYFDEQGTVALCFAPRLRPYLLKLKEKFTIFELKNVIQLKSSYSMRIYELLKQYEGIGKRTIEIQELKDMLKITQKSYDLYSNFKHKVILVAQKEMSQKTDITFTFEEIKEKRKVIAITFYIHANITKSKETIPEEIEYKMGMLIAEGLDVDTACKMAEKYSTERIEQNIFYAKKKKPDENTASYIRKAIEKNWAKKS